MLLLTTIALSALLGVARTALRAGDGLTGQYFANANWTAPPALSVVDSELSTAQIIRRWNNAPPSTFSVRWIGYLAVGRTGLYDFATTSDDGSRLYVDNQLVVDNGGPHGSTMRSGTVRLNRGPHRVVLEYVQFGGSYALDWSWSREGGDYTAVPAWALSQRRARYTTVVVARVVDWARWVFAILVLLFATWSVRATGIDERTWTIVRRHPRLACLALFAGLAVLETWPLATSPARLSRNDNGDTILNEWVLAWVAHQVPRDPLHLFDANIFYPAPNTLAFSEALLVQSIVGAPVIWAGGSPVLAYNIALLTGFALTGWTMCLVVARWTDDWAAGIAAGILMGFSAHTLASLPHLQAQHVEFLPLALLALDALLRQPRLRHAIWLATWYALQSLASYYLFVITTMGLVAATLARPESWWGKRRFSCVRYLAVGVGLAALVILPYLLPYWRANHDQGLNRSLNDLLPTFWQDYLTTPARFDNWLLQRWTSFTALFPGFAGLLLATTAIVSGRLKDPRPRMCLALGVCGVVLSFGASVPGYALLYHLFPPLHGIRAVSRFGYLGTVAVAVVAGYGVAELRQRTRRHWQTVILAVLIPIVLIVESLAAPIYYRRFEGIPAIYHRLAGDRDAVVAELPLPNHRSMFLNAPYMLNSTTSWYRLLNGYSGFTPASYFVHYDALRDFPSPSSVAALQAYGVTHIFVHLDGLGGEAIKDLRSTPALMHIADEGPIALYQVLR